MTHAPWQLQASTQNRNSFCLIELLCDMIIEPDAPKNSALSCLLWKINPTRLGNFNLVFARARDSMILYVIIAMWSDAD